MTDKSDGQEDFGERGEGSSVRADEPKVYQSPRILSIEPLEAAAALCDIPASGIGKTFPNGACFVGWGS